MKNELSNICTSEAFGDIFKEPQKMSDSLGLEPVKLPRKKLPRRSCGAPVQKC